MKTSIVICVSAAVFLCLVGALLHTGRPKAPDTTQQIKVREYEVEAPPEWNNTMQMGKFSIIGPPFYAVPWDLGADLCIRLRYSLTNLTDQPVYIYANYRTETGRKGKGNSANGGTYLLSPREERTIEALAPIPGFKQGMKFVLRLFPFDHSPQHEETDAIWGERLLVIDPLPLTPPQPPAGRLAVNHGAGHHFRAENVKLIRMGNTNLLMATVTNLSDQAQPIELTVAIRDGGFFRRAYSTVPARTRCEISSSYDLRTEGKRPLLAFHLAEPRQGIPDTQALRRHDLGAWAALFDTDLVSWGAVDLLAAAKLGDCVLVRPPPVKERAKLTAEKASAHFIFRYRPGSAAQNDIDQIAAEREEVYERLSHLLRMQLPRLVQIDLYPDGDAKGLGSGTTWTMANTVNDHQIAEVYSDNGGASPGHELAHIFSYHFPGHPQRGGDVGKPADAFVEGFAGCFSFPGNGERAIADLRKRGDTALLPPIPEIIASSDYGTTAEPMALVQFLVDKDPDRFKRFYVQVIADPKAAAIDQACRGTYLMTLAELEEQWHSFLGSPPAKK